MLLPTLQEIMQTKPSSHLLQRFQFLQPGRPLFARKQRHFHIRTAFNEPVQPQQQGPEDEGVRVVMDYEPVELRLQRYFRLATDKFRQLRNSFPSMLLMLLGGFVVGNLFGNFGPGLKSKFLWDGFGLLVVNFCLEIISYLYYSQKLKFLKDRPGIRQYLNYLKLGFLLGIFTDAFKVGS
eukprot:TRINITY_DN32926_c0_g1_i1.p1 TRINITY_DN32926_c0_g1~~TRINITY_DN32926_c0_g1_i1.p1  ORF type:complete len:180 (-),score=11.92 TRINITY_DN32926_c0_g1_i1:322-861(-)